MTSQGDLRPGVGDLRARRGYRPDVVSLACGRVAAARRQAGLPVPAFAAVLGQLLGWQPTPDMIRAWEAAVPPPGQVVVACEVVASRSGQGPGTPGRLVQAPANSAAGDVSPDGAEDDLAAMEAFRRDDLRVGGGRLYTVVADYLKTRVGPRLVLAVPGLGNRESFTSAASISEMAVFSSAQPVFA